MTHPEFFTRALVLLEQLVPRRLMPAAFAQISVVGGSAGQPSHQPQKKRASRVAARAADSSNFGTIFKRPG
jgi:hypothetical protein